MIKRILILLLIYPAFLLGAVSCKQPGNEPSSQVVINQTDSCRVNPLHTYQVFVPAFDKKCTSLPLVVIIDPHGAGKYAVTQFEEAAQKYPAIVVASNLIKNNYAGYIQSLDELVADVRSKYPVGKTMYISGFSGGARMAIDYATKHRVDGVIACGALAQTEQIKAVQCRLITIVGMDDFNFIESAQYIVNPANMPQNLLIELTNASHAWPEKKLLTNALGYFQLTSVEPNCGIKSKSVVKEYVADQKFRIDSLTKEKETLKAAMVARNMANSTIFEKIGSFHSVYGEQTQSQAYTQQLNELSQSIRFELKVRDAYFNALQQKDSVWWRKEISTLNSKIETEKDIFTQMAYKRIKGFLGIICYSLSNRYASGKEKEELEKIISIYRMVEPENTDMLNFSKVLEEIEAKDFKQK